MTPEEIKDTIRELRQQFYMMRNGAVGAQMRQGGVAYKVNFGLTLPQISAIAGGYEPDADLAEALWAATETRECRLAAPMLMPAEAMTEERARAWIAALATTEEADVLCHRLLRGTPYAPELALRLADDADDLRRYTGLRLMLLLLLVRPDLAHTFRATADREAAADRPTRLLATRLLDEIAFLTE